LEDKVRFSVSVFSSPVWVVEWMLVGQSASGVGVGVRGFVDELLSFNWEVRRDCNVSRKIVGSGDRGRDGDCGESERGGDEGRAEKSENECEKYAVDLRDLVGEGCVGAIWAAERIRGNACVWDVTTDGAIAERGESGGERAEDEWGEK
jgi:hypothetical protein